jgi:RimJ/RimL family protein N-acetyltransferase
MAMSHDEKAFGPPVLPHTVDLRDGRGCLIRPMTEDDAEALCAFLPAAHRESDFLNDLPGEFTKTVEEEKEFIRDHNAKPCSISMVAEVDGCIAGIAGGAVQERRRFVHHAEIGLAVAKAFWGQGIGRKLMERLVLWGRRAGLRKLYLKVFHDNDRAIALYRSLGFVEEARLVEDVLRADGTYGDTLIMSARLED